MFTGVEKLERQKFLFPNQTIRKKNDGEKRSSILFLCIMAGTAYKTPGQDHTVIST